MPAAPDSLPNPNREANRIATAVAKRLRPFLAPVARASLTAADGARIARRREAAILSAIHSGALPAQRTAGRGAWRIRREDLLAWIEKGDGNV